MGPLFAGGGAGDRDYKQIVRDAIDSIGEDAQLKFDTNFKHSACFSDVWVYENFEGLYSCKK